MRERLADTLDYVFEQVGSDLGLDPQDSTNLVSRIRACRQSPNLFACYYELVLALEADQIEEARALAQQMLAREPAAETRVAAIGDRDLAEAERYRRLLVPDPGMAAEPGPELLESTSTRVDAAFELLDRGYPDMSAEIRELLSEIVIAEGPSDPKAPTFDGASSYMLWGATLLNARGQTTVLDTAQALAHESGHNLLFGFCTSGSLVYNPDEELFQSPLRSDPRPMDGVFHATYVVARMHQTLSRLLASGVLSPEEERAALTDLQAHRANFFAGDEVVRKGGRLTPLGTEVIEAARSYMAEAA